MGNIPEWYGDFRAIIKVTETGFYLFNKKELLAHINWSDIKEVVAYRRDFKAELLVCFALRVSDDNGCIEIEEEMAGFKEFGTA